MHSSSEKKPIVKRKLPQKRCLRCRRPTSRRRDGRPICLACRVLPTELGRDRKMRRMGKLKGAHGRS